MKKRKATWKGIFIFAVTACLLILAANFSFYRAVSDGYQYADNNRKTQIVSYEKSDTIDVVFLGDSLNWAAFSPLRLFHEYGISSYNCATSGQWIYDSLVIFRKVLTTQNPKVLVLGADAVYSNVSEDDFNFSQKFPLFHYHGYFTENSLMKASKTKGANLSSKVVPYTGSLDYMDNATETQTIPTFNEKYLNQLYQLCREKGIELVMVSVPSPKNWTLAKEKGIQAWCDANQVTYIDYNSTKNAARIGIDWSTDTRDGGDHVNISGSNKVCQDFGKMLLENDSLQDHRTDSAYAEWEKLYSTSQYYQ